MSETQSSATAVAARPDADAPNLDYAGRTPYVAYTDSDVLASLVHPQTTEPLEVTFIIATQVMELHFNLLIHEWRLAIRALDTDDLAGALRALRRSVVTQDSLIQSWNLLSVMSAVEYNRFRGSLGKASGFQSFSYRELEFLIGAKNEKMLNPHSGMPAIHQQLQAAYDNPSLYDTALRLLGRRGLPVPAEVLARDVREPWTDSNPAVIEAWRGVYADNDGDSPLAELADVLVAIAERHSTWRFVHYTAVRRILGAKPGTGGSAGLAWLKRTVDAPVFIDLWDVRNVL
ncbi:MAG: tryptophan 2,3-dioxygenase family protein [Actinomycetota bacterium]|nr:tryptophan 2,3-dioxygenase family protein [Actinomycetota bacterium]MDQ2958011.1 tryptophan 2,3-dioxygenase family protein [Actinomycetota bacterium]